MRLQGTLGGSLYLQRDNDAFCSDVSTILGNTELLDLEAILSSQSKNSKFKNVFSYDGRSNKLSWR